MIFFRLSERLFTPKLTFFCPYSPYSPYRPYRPFCFMITLHLINILNKCCK